MVLPNIFKKKKTEEEKVEPKEEAKEVEAEKPAEIATSGAKKELKIGESWRILKSPHVTEKATDLAAENQYVFKVFPAANKAEIKKAIKDTYKVDVSDVKIINVPSRKRRLGRLEGWRKGYKKAIVKLKEGQKIEVLPR